MAKLSQAGQLPLGKDTPFNVALQRPTVNLREAENMNEEAAGVAQRAKVRDDASAFRFSKHGTLAPAKSLLGE